MKPIINFLLAGISIFLLPACSGNKAEEKAATETSSVQMPEPNPSATEATEPVPTPDTIIATENGQPEDLGTLPKTNSPTDLATSKRTPPSKLGKAAPMQAPPTINSNPQGLPTGYISRKEVSLQSSANDAASKTRAFKQFEGVIILESKMTDENGQTSKFPTWYKVECVDKKQGWVKANCVTLN